jgi:tetratricopeptide (TPR) repeat protein
MRLPAVVATAVLIGLSGAALSRLDVAPGPVTMAPTALSAGSVSTATYPEFSNPAPDGDFTAGVAALESGAWELALQHFAQFSQRMPHVPEAHVNAGFALLSLDRMDEAESSFLRATQLQPMQANAYYGLGLVYERREDFELARGAMRTYVHLTDGHGVWVSRARAALWEWETQHSVAADGVAK